MKKYNQSLRKEKNPINQKYNIEAVGNNSVSPKYTDC